MSMVKKFLSTVFLFCILFFVVVTPSFASNNFTTDYNVTYQITENGMTHATLQGTLTNTTGQFYASSYKMQVGFDTISNVKASDPLGPITPQVQKNDHGYLISLAFNKKAVGKGSTEPFTLTFDTPTIAKQYGKIWEINIPGISNPDDFTSFTVNVSVPQSFGEATYIKPAQASNGLTFTKEQLGKSGISIAFGDEQLYNMSLTYHLKNDKVYPVKTEIALPPSTNYQTIYITDIQPKPLNVTKDADGNWLAEYRLLPAQKMEVLVAGVAQVNLTPKQQSLSEKDFKEYTKEKPYWQTNDSRIKELANELKTPQAIYDYVVKTLQYDFSRVTDDKPRLGAVDALKNQDSAVCLEYTDLFIAIARAAGIPAREVNGFAYTENAKQRPISVTRDILHAWPEYYDTEKKTWVMVDPTWGSTTGGVDYFNVMDYDHLAFAIKGRESDYPVPAGGYKFIDDKNTKDVRIDFAKEIPSETTQASVETNFPSTAIAGFPIIGEVSVKNDGPAEIPAQLVTLSSTTLSPTEQILNTNGIPPFGTQTWKVAYRPTSIFENANTRFTVKFDPQSVLAGKATEQRIKVAPFYMTIWGIGSIIILGLLITFIVLVLKIRRYRLRH
jgi:transglutaminase-like putative cysteine protease